jgi:hypothetical protein
MLPYIHRVQKNQMLIRCVHAVFLTWLSLASTFKNEDVANHDCVLTTISDLLLFCLTERTAVCMLVTLKDVTAAPIVSNNVDLARRDLALEVGTSFFSLVLEPILVRRILYFPVSKMRMRADFFKRFTTAPVGVQKRTWRGESLT